MRRLPCDAQALSEGSELHRSVPRVALIPESVDPDWHEVSIP